MQVGSKSGVGVVSAGEEQLQSRRGNAGVAGEDQLW